MTVPGTTYQDLKAFRGRSWSYDATLPLSQGDLLAPGTVLEMTVKRSGDLDKLDAVALARITTTSGGVVITDATHARFTIPDAVMMRMPPGEHQYDVKAILPSGSRLEPLRGKFTVEADVGRS
jgi:hypothetical protein